MTQKNPDEPYLIDAAGETYEIRYVATLSEDQAKSIFPPTHSSGAFGNPNWWVNVGQRVVNTTLMTQPPPFAPHTQTMSKRRKGFPSETHVKRGRRFIKGGEIELTEKLGRNDPCPCGSRSRFQELLPHVRPL